MRYRLVAAALTVASLMIAAQSSESALAQGQPAPMAPGGFKPPPAAPLKPYQPVAVTPPAPMSDPSFVAFRKQLGDIAGKKDRGALAKLVVTQGFFWIQDKDLANKQKPGIDNLAKAIDLDAKDGSGWDTINNYAEEPTAAELPQQKGVFCAPAGPTFDQKAFLALTQSTHTDPSEWAYAARDGVEVRATAQPNAPVSDKLGLYFVRVLPDSTADDSDAPQFLHVAPPSGKAGFVAADAVVALGGDEMCYSKDASGAWKIAGYYGGVSQ